VDAIILSRRQRDRLFDFSEKTSMTRAEWKVCNYPASKSEAEVGTQVEAGAMRLLA
jgi:hypothetical protein